LACNGLKYEFRQHGREHVKKTDLYKNEALKVASRMKQAGSPARYGTLVGAAPQRREQRKLDQAAGLVPFAVKLNVELIAKIHALAQSRQVGLNDVVAELLTTALDARI
jgi:hypothetical protein